MSTDCWTERTRCVSTHTTHTHTRHTYTRGETHTHTEGETYRDTHTQMGYYSDTRKIKILNLQQGWTQRVLCSVK